ncbi:hypothetical protein THIX_60982 [Thiomonas sp. X19]|nr:hypothetical protein THIX_60982 [Thiomonas sp. X19]
MVLAGLLAQVFNLRATLMLSSGWLGAGFLFRVVAKPVENMVQDAHDEAGHDKYTPNRYQKYRDPKDHPQTSPYPDRSEFIENGEKEHSCNHEQKQQNQKILTTSI